MTGEPVISFSSVVKLYGDKKIGPIELAIGRGDIFGFLGPNGSGKTTCIRMLLGLVRPHSGRVELKGYDPLARHADALRGVGYSPELPNIQSFFTPGELLRLTADELGIGTAAVGRETERVLETVGLVEYSDTKVGRLSKGMVQRLSIAQALIGSPDLLIMDEPTIGLDPAGSAHLRDVFRAFTRDGGTIFLSSHMMSEVEDLCDSVGFMHRGALIFRGSVREAAEEFLELNELVVEAEGVTESCLESVRGIEGVADVRPLDGAMRIYVTKGAEIRPAVARTLVESGARVYTIREADRMLERAYIEALRSSDHET